MYECFLIQSSFQDAQLPTYSKRSGIDEFKVIKGRKCKASAAEFVVKMSNRFYVLMEEEETTSSSYKEVIKSLKPVGGGYDDSINVKQIKASELTKKFSHKHSSSRSSKFFSRISDQHLTAQKQSELNKSVDNLNDQSSKSADCFRVTESTEWFSDQHSSSIEQSYKVIMRKFNKKKETFKFKTVEFINDDSLEQFETPNPFKCLDILTEDCLEDTRSKWNMRLDPKRLLKKCRYCNFKKRSCDLNSYSCVAQIKRCFKCNKKGHYPQSMCCKASKTSKKVKVKNIQDIQKPRKFTKELLNKMEHEIRS